MIYFNVTLPLLVAVLFSYRRLPPGQRVGVGFTLWLVTYQLIFTGLLGIGLIQSHLGCVSLLGDCYVENYPSWLELYKLTAGGTLVAWCVLAVVKTARNAFFTTAASSA